MFDFNETLAAWVNIPSVSTDPQFKDGINKAADYVKRIFQQIGLEVEQINTAGHPIILAERKGPDSWPHVIIYGHYDVQPADPYEKWETDPFHATVKNGRMYGRGSADNKGPLLAHVAAVASILEENPDLPLRITFIVEGEEEIGSQSLETFLNNYKDRISGDFVFVSDTGSPNPEQIVVTTALRGNFGINVELIGPNNDLHSGLHGGAVRNPIQALATLCASLHNEDGSVNVPGFYDDVLPVHDWEKDELKKFPLTEAAYKKFLGVDAFFCEKPFTPLEAVRFRPTLEFNGIGGGYQGPGGKTVIPSKAFVKITCRLVPNQSVKDIKEKVIKTLKERCPSGVKMSIEHGDGGGAYLVVPPGKVNSNPNMNPELEKAFAAVDNAIEKHFGKRPLFLREGGSIPIFDRIKAVTGMDSLMVGLFTPDSNLHAPNESVHLEMLSKASAAFKDVLRTVASK